MSPAWLAILASAGWVLIAYAGYPLALALLARLAPRVPRRGDIAPPLSVVIAVHNGEGELARKLEGVLAQAYAGPLEVVVSSDGSTDGTESVAEGFASRGVVLVRGAERRGKEAAQAEGIARATGEILVFTDVSAQLEPGALRQIVRPFADPQIGCVSSEDVVESEGGEGAYVRYEMALRRLESEASTLIGLSGSFFAARRGLCSPWPSDLASDFRTALEAGRRGLRAVSEPSARARFGAIPETGREWRRKVRTVRRGLAVLFAYRDLLHPRFGRIAFTLWGHKLARFTAPFALLGMLLASAAAAPASPLAQLLLVAQLGFYALGALALAGVGPERISLARLAGFFMLVNASTLVAWGHHLTGRRVVMWQPTRR